MKTIFGVVMGVFLGAVLAAGCGGSSEEDYMRSANENLKKNDIGGVIADYEGLLNDYPDGEKAPAALLNLAALYQNKMDKSVPENESLEKAVKLYKEVYERFPQNDKAAEALFMAGYIEANDLTDFNAATQIYNKFLKEYPEHQLAASAREELENMGRSPEDILNEKSLNQF